MSSEHNRKLREQIAELEQRLVGTSFGDINRPAITAQIQALASQLAPETHWTTTPTFWVAVAAMVASCLAAYFSYLGLPQAQKPVVVIQPPEKTSPPAVDTQHSSQMQSAPASQPLPNSK